MEGRVEVKTYPHFISKQIMLSQQERDALNLLRWGSTIAIVACHFLQAYNNDWCWVLNIGVQVFFFLSGFLYGGRRIENIKQFYFRRIIKLYIPYFIWVTVAMALLFLIGNVSINPIQVAKEYATVSHHPGLNHLWFMFVIFVCYLLLPIMDRWMSRKGMLTLMVFTLCVITLIIIRGMSLYVWVALYYIGYLCGRYPKIQVPTLLLSIFTVFGMAIYLGFNFGIFRYTNIPGNIFHAACGIVVSLGIYLMVRRLKFNNKFSQMLTNGGGVRTLSYSPSVYIRTIIFGVSYAI